MDKQVYAIKQKYLNYTKNILLGSKILLKVFLNSN